MPITKFDTLFVKYPTCASIIRAATFAGILANGINVSPNPLMPAASNGIDTASRILSANLEAQRSSVYVPTLAA